MYSEDDLASAVKAGVLTEEAVNAFRLHIAHSKNSPVVDEEYFRLVTGFNDVFVVIACVLLLLSVHWIGASFASWLGACALAVVAWLLAEFFIIKRHMALPAIVLLTAFVGGVSAISVDFTDNLAIPTALAAGAAWLHWLRFKVPITVATGMAALIVCIVTLLVNIAPLERFTNLFLLVSGATVFFFALRWDASDIQRTTRKADVAFWLHLLAAPLLVHPVIDLLGFFDGDTQLTHALAVVVLYIMVSLVSLAIDRRALMVSALAYVLYAFSTLLEQYGVVSLSFAITALFIGSALLLLSAFWHVSRTFVVKHCPVKVQMWLAPL